MAVYTKLLRHLNARWIVDVAEENRIYCGISKNQLTLDDSNLNINDVIDKCYLFSKVRAFFVKESDAEHFDAKFLTKQVYDTTEHTIKDSVCYWKFITKQEALETENYNTDMYFILDNISESTYSEFKNIRSFYFLYDFKQNGSYPSEDQFFKDPNKTYTAESLIIKERIGFVANVDHGQCDNTQFTLNIPDGFREKFNYLLSF